MQRIALKFLEEWISKSTRAPLVIRGARQVGKTELVRIFCEKQGLDLVEINLEEFSISEFENDTSFNIDRAINDILSIKGKKLSNKTLIFIDEIQECMSAYKKLRFFKEKKPEVFVITAGSLLEIQLKKNKISAPVGRVEYLFLGPMTFREFLLANKKEGLWDKINNITINTNKNPISESVHHELCILLKQYFFVGGMPEAVKEFIDSNGNYLVAREIQNRIIESYKEDIPKYSKGKSSQVINEVYNKYPYNIGEKVKHKNFSNEKSTYISEALEILKDVFLLQKVFHSNCSGVPLMGGSTQNLYKIFHLDIGLYNCQMNLQWNDLNLNDQTQLITKGKMAEQFVAQHLYLNTYRNYRNRVYYWLKDKSSQKSEIDFVIANPRISPIEVKSGKTGSIKSLLNFMFEKQKLKPTAMRLDLAYRENFCEKVSHKISKDQSVQFDLKSFPLYCIENL